MKLIRQTLVVGCVAVITAMSLQSPSHAATPVGTLTPVTPADVASILDGNGFSIDPSSIEVIGNVLKFTQVSAGDGFQLDSPGLLMSSGFGEGAPTESIPSASATASHVEQLMETALAAAGYTGSDARVTNLSAVVFDIVDASRPSLQLDFLFLSNEGYLSNYDVAVVIVDGVNYAKLPNGSILRVNPGANLESLVTGGYTVNSNRAYQVNSGATTQSITALLDPARSRHSFVAAVGDTDDDVAPSFLLISQLGGSSSLVGGISDQLEPEPESEPVFTMPAFWLWIDSSFEITNKPGVIGQFTVDTDVTWELLPSADSASFSISDRGELLLTRPLTSASTTLSVVARDADGNSFTRMVEVRVAGR